MKEIFNIILIITILVTVYYFIQNSTKNTTNTSTENIASLSTNINTNTNKSIIPEQKQIEKFTNLDTKYINFDYDLRPIEKEFIKEQKNGVYLNTWYPNTWIDHIDENGNPVYQSLDTWSFIPTMWSALKKSIEDIESLKLEVEHPPKLFVAKMLGHYTQRNFEVTLIEQSLLKK